MKRSTLRRMIVRTARQMSGESALSLAAAIAFYSALSLAPLLLLLVGVAGTLWEQAEVQREIVRQVEALIGPEGARLVTLVLDGASRPGGGPAAVLVGAVLVLFGATTVFSELQYSLNRLWGVQVRSGHNVRRILWTRLTSLGLILALGFLILVSLVLSSAVSFVTSRIEIDLPASAFLWRAADLLGSLALYAVAFGTIFKTLPDVKIAWRDVTMGAVLTAILFSAGKGAIGFYLGRNLLISAYGAAGSLFVLLLWVYYTSILVLAGAQFTREFAREHGRDLEPKDYAERVTD